MIVFLYGKVISKNKYGILLEQNNNGIFIFMNNLENTELNTRQKIYVFESYSNFGKKYVYGFKKSSDRFLFNDLIKLHMLSPFKIMELFRLCDFDNILLSLLEKNSSELAEKLDVKEETIKTIQNHFKKKNNFNKKLDKNNEKREKVIEIMNDLGYEEKEIESELNQVDITKFPIDDIIDKIIELKATNIQPNFN